MAITFADLALEALTDLGVIASGETPETDDLNNALRAMNGLLDQWAAERLQIFTTTATTFAITSGTQAYTVGSGGDVNVARPTYVDHVTYKFQPSGGPYPVEFKLVRLTDDDWAGVSIKTLPSALPTAYYYNPTFPLGTLTFWPIPTSPPGPLTGTLYGPQQVAEFLALNTVIALPPGYRRMIVKSLAVELAPSFQRNLPPEIERAASEAKAAVKVSNVHMSDLGFESSAMGSGAPSTYYIRSG